MDRQTHGKIISLLKEIHFAKPSGTSYSWQFFPPNPNSLGEFSPIGVAWWLTDRGRRLVREIGMMYLERQRSSVIGDSELVVDAVQRAMMTSMAVSGIFRSVLFPRSGTLFDLCEANNPMETAERLGLLIQGCIDEMVCDWLVVYPLPRVKSDGLKLNSETLGIASKGDMEFWQGFAAKVFLQGNFDPRTAFGHPMRGGSGFDWYETLAWARVRGTLDGCLFETEQRFRTMLTLAIAFRQRDTPRFPHRSGVEPVDYCLILPAREDRHGSTHNRHIGKVFPYFVEDIDIGQDTIEALQSWYSRLALQTPKYRNRVEKSAFFVSQAMVHGGTVSYILCFTALDALYGRRGAVETSVIQGVMASSVDGVSEDQIRRLYDLRNELVHGSSRDLREWSYYHDYVRHYDEAPEASIARMVLSCLKSA